MPNSRQNPETRQEKLPTFERGDLTLHYTERGKPDAPAVVLMHGLTLSSRSMERLAESLPSYRVILLDLHGHGKSSRPTDDARYTMAEFTDDVVALLDHLELERAVVGGMSLGANVAFQLALDHPERVQGLVLEMPVFGRGDTAARLLFRALDVLFRGVAPIGDALRPLLSRVPLPRTAPAEIKQATEYLMGDHRALAAIARGLNEEPPPPSDAATLALIDAPTLLIGHKGDPLHVFADVEEVADGLPNSSMVATATFFDFRVRPDRLAWAVAAALATWGIGPASTD